MITWNKSKVGSINPEQIVIENGKRKFLLVPDASFDLDTMCLLLGQAPVVQSGTRGFVALPGPGSANPTSSCSESAWVHLVAEGEQGNTVLVNTVTSTPSQRWDIVVTNNREAVELLAQPSGAYAILGTDHTAVSIPASTPEKSRGGHSKLVWGLAGTIIGGVLGGLGAGVVGASLGGVAGALAGSRLGD